MAEANRENKNFDLLLKSVEVMPVEEKLKLYYFLKGNLIEIDKVETHKASEVVLAKDWLTEEENEAWG